MMADYDDAAGEELARGEHRAQANGTISDDGNLAALDYTRHHRRVIAGAHNIGQRSQRGRQRSIGQIDMTWQHE
jgi:hypothetical protein